GGSLASMFGPLVGTQAGSGMALIMVLSGVLGVIAALCGYLFPAVRNAETLIPDHADSPEEASATSGIVGELQPAD
nr:hypothetical protein [Herpetosiphonaceae bacterium]